MNTLEEVLTILDKVLNLEGRALLFREDTALLGAVPELDSMAVVALIAALEDWFCLAIDDEDINATTFATVGSLTHFVGTRIAA